MKRVLGVILILVAIVGGIYVAGWLFFVKAIADMIVAIKAGFIAMDIAIGIAEICICMPIATTIACGIAMLGFAMIVD